MSGRDVVVVGASAGGVEALHALLGALPPDLPAVVMVVLHTSSHTPDVLAQVLARRSVLPVEQARHGAPIERGRVYVAPVDFHLLVGRSRIQLSHGPRENGVRPAVDPLFRTAAQSCGARVVGVVLTGNLGDGTDGLRAIRRHGGIAVVQDPGDAAFPGMPRSALERVGADHVATLARLPALLDWIVREPADTGEGERMHDDMHDDVHDDVHDDMDEQLDGERELAAPLVDEALDVGARRNEYLGGRVSSYTCPECSGTLWEIDEGGVCRYRCRVGHTYTEDVLHAEQANALESAIWTALTALEEHAAFTLRMADRVAGRGHERRRDAYIEKARLYEQRAQVIRNLLHRTTFTVNADMDGA